MELQDLINIALGGGGAVLGYILKGIRDSVNALHVADKELTDRVQHIEVLVAGKYITREEFTAMHIRLFDKLDMIEKSIARKADK